MAAEGIWAPSFWMARAGSMRTDESKGDRIRSPRYVSKQGAWESQLTTQNDLVE